MACSGSLSYKTWVVENTVRLPEDGIMGQDPLIPTAAVAAFSPATNPSAPSDLKFSRVECSDDDSEDDIPLSDLVRVTSDDQHVSLKRSRPPSPSMPDEEEPIRTKRRTVSLLYENICFLKG